MLEMRGHVAKADNLVAQVTFGSAGTVGDFVRGEARQNDFRIRWARGITFLGNLQVAELAENELARAGGGAVEGEL